MTEVMVKEIERNGRIAHQEVVLPGGDNIAMEIVHRPTPEFLIESIKGSLSFGDFLLEAYFINNMWQWEVTHQRSIVVASGASANRRQLFFDVLTNSFAMYNAIIRRAKAMEEAGEAITQAFLAMGYDPKAFGF